jgi:hypothetical protein
MPVHRVGRDCWQWGSHGKVYCGRGARQKAERQGRAAYSHGYRRKGAREGLDPYRNADGRGRVSFAVGFDMRELPVIVMRERASHTMHDDDADRCSFRIVERLRRDEVERRYVELHRRGRHGAGPDAAKIERLRNHEVDWVVAWIPLDALNFQTEAESGIERRELARFYATRGPFPPGIATYSGRGRRRRSGMAYVIDGNHRVLGAEYRGDCAIRMMMPASDYAALINDGAPTREEP